MAEDSDVEKSEAPTQHRQEKAREEGQIPRSRELTSMLMLLVGCAMLWLDGAYLARQLAAMLAQGLHFDHGLIGNDRQSLTAAAQPDRSGADTAVRRSNFGGPRRTDVAGWDHVQSVVDQV